MSIKLMSIVWDINLPDSEKLVLLALADNANDEGRCWPSIATIARKCSKSERTVQTAIQSLAAAGHLTRHEVVGRGVNYDVHPRSDCTPAMSAPPQGTTQTPAAVAPKPSITIKTEAKASVCPKSKSKPKTKWADGDNVPLEWITWAAKELGWRPPQAMTEARRMIDSAVAHGRTYSDWMAAWRSWCRSPYCKTVPVKQERLTV